MSADPRTLGETNYQHKAAYNSVADWSDEEILTQGGDGFSFPLKAYKARMFAEEIIRLRKLLKEKP